MVAVPPCRTASPERLNQTTQYRYPYWPSVGVDLALMSATEYSTGTILLIDLFGGFYLGDCFLASRELAIIHAPDRITNE